jgi:hypothetical protein
MRMLGLDRRDVHSAIRATLCVSVFVARRTVRGFRHPNAAMTARKYRPFADGLANGSYPTLCCPSRSVPVREENATSCCSRQWRAASPTACNPRQRVDCGCARRRW